MISTSSTIENEFGAIFDHPYTPHPNAYPSQSLPVITSLDPQKITLLRWGLIPYWAKNPEIAHYTFNAMAEKIFNRPSFKKPIMLRRCLIPANGFFEWRTTPGSKTPFLVYARNQPLFAFAGIWDSWMNPDSETIIRTFSIITVPANERISVINDRMPVILNKNHRSKWLDTNSSKQVIRRMLKSYDNRYINAYPVSRGINDPAHQDTSLIKPEGMKLEEDDFDPEVFLN